MVLCVCIKKKIFKETESLIHYFILLIWAQHRTTKRLNTDFLMFYYYIIPFPLLFLLSFFPFATIILKLLIIVIYWHQHVFVGGRICIWENSLIVYRINLQKNTMYKIKLLQMHFLNNCLLKNFTFSTFIGHVTGKK